MTWTPQKLRSTSDELDGVKSQNLLLMAVLATFAVLADVMSVMFFSPRTKIAGMNVKTVGEEGLPPPQS